MQPALGPNLSVPCEQPDKLIAGDRDVFLVFGPVYARNYFQKLSRSIAGFLRNISAFHASILSGNDPSVLGCKLMVVSPINQKAVLALSDNTD